MLNAVAPPPRADPWRRTSGMHRLRTRRQLAIVRALWEARTTSPVSATPRPAGSSPTARSSPPRAPRPPRTEQLAPAARVGRPLNSTPRAEMWPVIDATYQLPDTALPRPAASGDGPPPPSRWPDRDPVAAARLGRARAALAELAETHNIPVENLLTPDLVRRLAWSPPSTDVDGVSRLTSQWRRPATGRSS